MTRKAPSEVLNDTAVAVLDEPAAVTYHGWSHLESAILRVLDGSASLNDHQAVHERFTPDALQTEIARVKRVLHSRESAVSAARLEELAMIQQQETQRVARELDAEDERFAKLKAEHDAKVRSLELQRRNADEALKNATRARDTLRENAPVPVRRLHKSRMVAVTSAYHESVTVAESRIRTIDGVLAMTGGYEDLRMIRDQSHLPGLWSSRAIHEKALQLGDTTLECRQLLLSVQDRMRTERPALAEAFAKASAARDAAVREADAVLDCYLPQ